jgi:hypothetical protein
MKYLVIVLSRGQRDEGETWWGEPNHLYNVRIFRNVTTNPPPPVLLRYSNKNALRKIGGIYKKKLDKEGGCFTDTRYHYVPLASIDSNGIFSEL